MAKVNTIFLPTEYTLTVTADASSVGHVVIVSPGSEPSSFTAIATSSTTTFGPFNVPKQFSIASDTGELTAVSALTSFATGVTASATERNILDGATMTTAELNNACDVSARTQELVATAAVTAGVQSVELNHISTTIAATIADAVNHQGIFIVKATTEPGVAADHTLTLTAGTFNGSDNIATFADINDTLVVYFDSAGNGTVVENVGSVALS